MRPAERLLWNGFALSLLALAGIVWPPARLVFTGAAAGLTLVAMIDALRLWRLPTPTVVRDAPAAFALGVWADVQLELRCARLLRLQVADHYPAGFQARGLPITTEAEPRRRLLTYAVLPTVRGEHRFTTCVVRVRSPLGLWTLRRKIPVESVVRVYPNYAAVMKYALLDANSQLIGAGVRVRQRRGEGLDFHQLREYRIGDTFRQIDWKATARIGRHITKEYQDEHDQQVVFLLDAGRRMLAQEDEYSHFDHVLDAMMLLGYVALRQGDAIGMLTFGGANRWLPPQKGPAAINALLNSVYDLQPQAVASDYQAAATQLALRQQRRALVVVLTNVRDEDADDLGAALALLRRQHLVLLASLREDALDEALQEPVATFRQALRYSAVNRYLRERRGAHEALQMPGVLLQDVTCAQLPAAITNSYMQIKRAGAL